MIPIDRAVLLLPAGRPGPTHGPGGPTGMLLGLTLPERAVLTAAEAGVNEFLLVGESGRGFEEAAARLKRDRRVRKGGLRVEFLALPDLPKAARERATGRPFWLIRGDLVFGAAVLTRAAAMERSDNESLHLSVAGEVYSGISLCPAAAFTGLADALATPGSGSPAGGLPPGIPGRRVEVDGSFCLRVDSPEARRKAARLLLDSARKPTDGFVSRNFNRHVSLFLTRGFIKTGVHPAVLSILTIFIGLASGWFISRGNYAASALGGFLFAFASIFDGCDGETARLTFRTSKSGAFLDLVGDAVIFNLFFLCLPLGLYRGTRDPRWAYLGILALVSLGTFYLQLIRYMKKARLGSRIVAVAKNIEGSAGTPGFRSRLDALASKLTFLYRRDFFSAGACLTVMAGGSAILMYVLAVLLPLEPVYMFFFARRHLRLISAAGERRA